MNKKTIKEIQINDKILSNPENEKQAMVQKVKENKKEKIIIQMNNAEKLSLFSMGNDSIEKSPLNFSDESKENLKISLTGDKDINKKSKKGHAKTKTQTISQIIKDNQSSKISSTFSDYHFSMVFEGAKLLTPNVIFSALQYHKYDIPKVHIFLPIPLILQFLIILEDSVRVYIVLRLMLR